MQKFIEMSSRQKKEKKERSGKKADEILMVCPKCNAVWSDICIGGDRCYNIYRKGEIPTYGKQRKKCKTCAGV
tara:strand:- start:678 stop:896 length:219 start_codon:yes stop_codon:yes gene_type:complete